MAQKYTEARKEGNKRWDEKNLDRVSLAMPKGKKEDIKAAASAAGVSMNAYIVAAVDEKMERDGFKTEPATE
ncbi:MAG: Arc family DNA-binding protein [Clostridiales bacterium]|nr:Arc family DNA-binding protein [Clostridiales bacterium]